MDHAIRDRSVCRIENSLSRVPFPPAGVSRPDRVRHGISGEMGDESSRVFLKEFPQKLDRSVEVVLTNGLGEIYREGIELW